MPQTKISGKFYPLKNEEWLDSINQLTHSELKILYYIRSLDPYSNGINLTPVGKRNELTKVADIEAACLTFDVNVTAEEV
jgi:hypothetical protein